MLWQWLKSQVQNLISIEFHKWNSKTHLSDLRNIWQNNNNNNNDDDDDETNHQCNNISHHHHHHHHHYQHIHLNPEPSQIPRIPIYPNKNPHLPFPHQQKSPWPSCMDFISTKSKTPLKVAALPIGNWMGTSIFSSNRQLCGPARGMCDILLGTCWESTFTSFKGSATSFHKFMCGAPKWKHVTYPNHKMFIIHFGRRAKVRKGGHIIYEVSSACACARDSTSKTLGSFPADPPSFAHPWRSLHPAAVKWGKQVD